MAPTLDSPLSFPVTLTRRSKIMFLPVWKDKDGSPLMNAAKQLLVKPIHEPFSVLMITGTMAKAPETTDAFCAQYLNKVSTGGWRAWGDGMAWVFDISTDASKINGLDVDEVQVTVACLDRKWNTMFPNVGYSYKDGSDLKTFKASDGGRFIGKLDVSGGEAAVDSDLIITEWQTKQTISFSGLGF